MDDPRDTVKKGYAQGRYAEEFGQRDSLTEFEGAWFDRFTEYVPADGHILDLGCGTGVPYDGLICLYTLFHLPKAEHPAMIERMARHLRPGSPLLLTTGAAEGDSSEDNWCGGPMTWSSLDPDNYRDLLSTSGFDLLAAEYEGSPDAAEYHWWALARKSEGAGRAAPRR
jgi:hypothetical protein